MVPQLQTQQYVTLKAYAQANGGQSFIDAADDQGLADWFNAASTVTVWKRPIAKNIVGKTFQANALAAITAGNNDKLANFAAWNEEVDPTRSDQRAFFDDVFSVAAGAGTRTALNALWRRIATRAEAALATGTGTDANPATLVADGEMTPAEASLVRVA